MLNEDGSVDMSATPYKSEKGVLAAIEKAESRINNASGKTYDELKAEHIADYKSQFDTVKFMKYVQHLQMSFRLHIRML